jgi:pyruvate formate lyase activating enzyme
MQIAGLERCSFVDWPGRLAAVVFAPGCNLDCYFCHNRCLLGAPNAAELLEPGEVMRWLGTRRGLLDGVVFSGGEALLQPKLEGFIRRVRALGFAVKLDTNGTRPEALARLIMDDLVDYVAMDLKAPAERYDEVCGVSVDQQALHRTIGMLLSGVVAYEFRTTVLPQFSLRDVVAMAARIRGADRYVLQQYQPVPQQNPAAPDLRIARTPHSAAAIQEMALEAQGYVKRCELRGWVADAAHQAG